MTPEQEKDVARMTEYHDRLERAARQGPDTFTAAWSSPPSGLGCHEIDTGMVIGRVNREELRILGYREEEMLGHKALEFIVMQDTAKRAIDDKFSGARELKPFIRTFKRADGTPTTLLLLDRHLKDAEGRVVGIRTSMMAANLAF